MKLSAVLSIFAVYRPIRRLYWRILANLRTCNLTSTVASTAAVELTCVTLLHVSFCAVPFIGRAPVRSRMSYPVRDAVKLLNLQQPIPYDNGRGELARQLNICLCTRERWSSWPTIRCIQGRTNLAVTTVFTALFVFVLFRRYWRHKTAVSLIVLCLYILWLRNRQYCYSAL